MKFKDLGLFYKIASFNFNVSEFIILDFLLSGFGVII